jgi:hypothetical protein
VVSAMSAEDGTSAPILHDAHAQLELDADGVPLGAISIEANGADSWPGGRGRLLVRR